MRPSTQDHTRPRSRLSDDEGTALTELAITAPLFILIVMWAQFFVDLGIVKLKAEEIARFALWEMTVQQPIGGTVTSARDRFRDLASPNHPEFQRDRGIGTASFTAPLTVNITMSDRITQRFGGSIPPPQGQGGGIWDRIVAWVNRAVGRVVDAMLRRFGLEFDSAARVDEVRITAPNRIFPGFSFLSLLTNRPGPDPTINVYAGRRGSPASPTMLVDSWKAWASKYNPATRDLRNIETPLSESYATGYPGDDGLPERIVSERVSRAAFFGAGSTVATVGRAFTYVGFPNPMGTDTHAGSRNRRDRDGPITMLPGRTTANGVARGKPIRRFGNQYVSTQDSKQIMSVGNSGEDYPRVTVPARIFTTEWTRSGGPANGPVPNYYFRNPYVEMYNCRDAFYMGSVRGGGLGSRSRIDMSFDSYQQQMYRGCPRGNPRW